MEQVGVCGAPPLYVAGLRAHAAVNGYQFDAVADPWAWASGRSDPTFLVGVRSDGDLRIVDDLKSDFPEAIVVTIIDDCGISPICDSLKAGAVGCVTWDTTGDELLLILGAALKRKTVVPTEVAVALARESHGVKPELLEENELGWLQSLAARTTVAKLGHQAGFSEREMYRRLRDVYRKMGVTNRTDALLKASRLGWLA